MVSRRLMRAVCRGRDASCLAPPHRPVRAAFPHTVPTAGTNSANLANDFKGVYTAAGLARLVEQNNGAVAGEKEDREKRLWFSRVTQVDVAADGTFRLPEDIIQFAGLKAELVLVGVNDHYEIWDVDRWDDYCEPAETGLSLNEIVGVMKNVAKHLVGGFRSTTDNASTFNPVFCLQELLQAEVKCEVDVDEDNARCTEP